MSSPRLPRVARCNVCCCCCLRNPKILDPDPVPGSLPEILRASDLPMSLRAPKIRRSTIPIPPQLGSCVRTGAGGLGFSFLDPGERGGRRAVVGSWILGSFLGLGLSDLRGSGGRNRESGISDFGTLGFSDLGFSAFRRSGFSGKGAGIRGLGLSEFRDKVQNPKSQPRKYESPTGGVLGARGGLQRAPPLKSSGRRGSALRSGLAVPRTGLSILKSKIRTSQPREYESPPVLTSHEQVPIEVR